MECCLSDYTEYCNDDHAANMYWIGLWKLEALNTSASLETRGKGWMWQEAKAGVITILSALLSSQFYLIA